jgi:uroporphyrinogen-III synthase
MLQAAARPDLAAVGEKARQWARRFGIAETWGQYRSTFEEALERKRRWAKGAA